MQASNNDDVLHMLPFVHHLLFLLILLPEQTSVHLYCFRLYQQESSPIVPWDEVCNLTCKLISVGNEDLR